MLFKGFISLVDDKKDQTQIEMCCGELRVTYASASGNPLIANHSVHTTYQFEASLPKASSLHTVLVVNFAFLKHHVRTNLSRSGS